MLSKYWKNTVLTSAVDHYCLVCESHLRSLADVDVHIDKPVHRKKLDSTPYLEKHKNDKIRQVSSGYYCEVCNLLYATTTKLSLHLSEPNHVSKLGFYQLKRSGNSILAYDDIVIDEQAWNGFIDNTCIICDEDFTNESIHKNEKKHILNLAQSKIEFGDGKSIYRVIDHTSRQCLTCNDVLVTTATSTHFDCSEHKSKYERCRDLNARNGEAKVDVTKSDSKKNNKKVNMQKEEIPVRSVAANNGKKVNSNKADADNDSDDDYLHNTLDAKDYIIKKDGNNICILCDWLCNSDMSLNDHVKSTHHLTLLKQHKKRLQKKKSGKRDTDDDDGESESVDNDDHDKKNNESIDKISESTAEFARERIEIKLETRTASCKKCSKNLDFEYDFIKNHIEEHKKKDNIKNKSKASKFDFKESKNEFESKTLYTKPVSMKQKDQNQSTALVSEEMTNFAKKHELVYKNNKYFCPVCSLSLTPTLDVLKEHVVATAHKNRLARQTNVPSRNLALKMPSKDFLKTVTTVENVYSKDIVINDELCVNILSFHIYTKHEFRLRCQPCGVSFDFDHADIHRINDRHGERMQDTLVVYSLKDEFVREIRNGALHCGFCNLVVNSGDMEDHLDSTSHKANKRSAQDRLQRYLPGIMQERRKERFAEFVFMKMLADASGFPF